MSGAGFEAGNDGDTLSLWLACPSAVLPEDVKAPFVSMISGEERAHLESLHFPRDRREYLVAHVLARTALSHCHPIPPEAWHFSRNPYGKPAIDPECGLHFNLAHSSELTACLIYQRGEVGVDVEPYGRGFDILEIASTVFSPQELAQLEPLDETEKTDHMLTLWTLKEAFVKAQGKGFSLPLKTISFLRDDATGFRLHVEPSEKLDSGSNYRFCLIEQYGHRIAVVADSKAEPRVELWELTSLMGGPKRLAEVQPAFYPLDRVPKKAFPQR